MDSLRALGSCANHSAQRHHPPLVAAPLARETERAYRALPRFGATIGLAPPPPPRGTRRGTRCDAHTERFFVFGDRRPRAGARDPVGTQIALVRHFLFGMRLLETVCAHSGATHLFELL
jgi:hypothetical protein